MGPCKAFVAASVCFFGLLITAGCGGGAGNRNSDLSPDTLSAAALATHSRYVKMQNAGEAPPAGEIPASCWAKEIEALHPLRVYLHRVNVVVVQRTPDGEEEGKYITTIISSYVPQNGDDGFTFTNQDAAVYDFRRVRQD